MKSTSASQLVRLCASTLATAEAQRRPVEPLTASHPHLTITDAYAIQQINIAARLSSGERIVGHKVGLTAKAMQELFGVHEPDYGHLLDTMVLDERTPLDVSTLIDPQIEVEPAFVLSRPLKGPGLTGDDVLAATDHVRVCFEIIDSRIVDWRIRVQDTIADNGSSARIVLGANKVKPAVLALDSLETTLQLDGEIVERGNTAAILGHPANGVAWLANKLAAFGIELQTGDVVLPGTCTRSRRIAGHRSATGTIAGLGDVTLQLINSPSIVRAH